MQKKARSKVVKTCKLPIAKLQRKLWILCRLLTRKIHGNTCYTCDKKNLVGYDFQTGHMIPKSTCGAYLKYDLRILRPQCSQCNLWHDGEGATFLRNMIIREGQEFVDKIFEDKLKVLSPKEAYSRYEYQIEKYTILLEDIGKT